MFPDMMSQVSGSYVGVVLSSELPVADRELFEDLLKQMTDLRIQVKHLFHAVIHRNSSALEFTHITQHMCCWTGISVYLSQFYSSPVDMNMTK